LRFALRGAQVTWDLVILVFLLFLAVIYPYEAVFHANDDKTERTKPKPKRAGAPQRSG
jgi:hypothetical protein